MLRNIASTTRQKLNSTPSAPILTQIPGKSILKKTVIQQGDLFENPNTNFGHCVSSDLVMASGIATHFFRLFPDLNDIRQRKMFLPPGSLIARFSQQRQNWIYNLVTKQHGNDRPTYQNLHKSLCRMKSHMLEHGITEISLP